MRCLITGASGWVGYAFVQRWASRYGMDSVQLLLPPTPLHDLEAKRANALADAGFDMLYHDLLDPALPVDSIHPFDLLIHCAAYTHTEKKDPAVHVNDLGTQNLLDALGELLNGKQVIYFGSCASLDEFNPPLHGIAENHPCKPLTVYGKTKWLGEQIVKESADRLKYRWHILRLPTVYGPGYRPGGLFDVIKSGQEGFHPITRVGWPGALSLLYIDDLTTWLMNICEEGLAKNQVLHLADPKPVGFTELFGGHTKKKLRGARGMQRILLFVLRRCWFPHFLFISGWRLCHLLGDSMVLNTDAAEKLCPMEYMDLQEGLRRTFAQEDVV